MRAVAAEMAEVEAGETMLAIADAVEDQARDLMRAVRDGSEAEKDCAGYYFVACSAFARRIRAAVGRMDLDVLAHLEGPCKAH